MREGRLLVGRHVWGENQKIKKQVSASARGLKGITSANDSRTEGTQSADPKRMYMCLK